MISQTFFLILSSSFRALQLFYFFRVSFIYFLHSLCWQTYNNSNSQSFSSSKGYLQSVQLLTVLFLLHRKSSAFILFSSPTLRSFLILYSINLTFILVSQEWNVLVWLFLSGVPIMAYTQMHFDLVGVQSSDYKRNWYNFNSRTKNVREAYWMISREKECQNI